MTRSSATAGQPSERRKRGAPDKRAQVLDAAVQEFLANGFDQTSMEGVAARAGVAKTTVYAHFPDKFTLFKSVVDRSSRSLAVQLDEAHFHESDPHARLESLMLTIVEATTVPEFLAFLRVMVSESARRPDLMYATDPGRTVDLIGLISSTLSEEARQHDYELSDAPAFATLLLRIIVSSPQLDTLLFSRFQPDRALLEAHVKWVTTIFLRGIEPRAGETRTVAAPPDGHPYPWLPATRGGS